MYVYIYIYCVCLDCIENRLCLVSAFFSWILCTVYGTRKYEKKKNLSLKLGPMVLFIYLKIILLQYFQ